MSPTLLEGVAVLVVIAVAWQIGVRLAPDIMSMARRAINQLYGNYPAQIDQGAPHPVAPQKEQKNDTENQSNQ